jgi:hypothetical protein
VTNREGFVAATGLVLVGIAYAVAVGVGISEAGLVSPIVDPALAAMEIITLIAAFLIVLLFAAVYGYAGETRKTLGLIALSFGVLMAGLTSGVHFVALTAGRQTGLATLEWPSTLYAVELLAWDVFLGLALLFAAPVFDGSGLNAVARWLLVATGILCLVGTIGPVIGDMALQRIGILGYGVALPITCGVLAVVFRAGRHPSPVSRRSGNA